ncbi:MAG: hypothetical protein PHW92_01365 [Lutibacter sp.]|nr:hypothetical protein [Lutibacter sp.]
MISENYNTKQKQICIKAYQHLWELEETLQFIENKKELHLQISILGKVNQFNSDKENSIINKNKNIKAHWKSLFGDRVNFGSFNNPEIGTVFIVGFLSSIFLHKINGKPLAMLSSGIYGILRGLGVSEAQTTIYLKMLNCGSYLLVFRGSKNDLGIITKVLEEKENG